MWRTVRFGVALALGVGLLGWSAGRQIDARASAAPPAAGSAFTTVFETSAGDQTAPGDARPNDGENASYGAPVVGNDERPVAVHAPAVHQTVLRATLDPVAHSIEGDETIRWKNTSSAPVDTLYLHLYLNAFKNESSLFLRNRLGAGRGGRIPSSWGYTDIKQFSVRAVGENQEPRGDEDDVLPRVERTIAGDPDDETDMRVALSTPCPPGAELDLKIHFVSKLPTIVERVGYQGSFHMVAQWFPKVAQLRGDGSWNHFAFHRLSEFAADFGSYDVTLDVPTGYVVGATGRRVEQRSAAGRDIVRYEQSDVHDFAWTAWDQFREQQSTTAEGIELRFLYPAGHEPAVKRAAQALRGAIACYGRRYGAYPYRTLTVVHPPPGAEEAGGMEYPTLITTGGTWYGPPAARAAETLAVHEFGHQHFYGLVASDEHRWPFLDEGVNSYGESQCMEEMYGTGSALDLLGWRVQMAALMREGALATGRDEAIATAAPAFPTAHHYGSLVYARTASLLRTLGGAFGRDVVDRGLGSYTRRQRFAHPQPSDLLDAFGDAGGPDLREALRVGLFERGWVDYAVEQISAAPQTRPGGIFDGPSGRETIATGTGTGTFTGVAVVVRRGTLALPVDIDLHFADGTKLRQSWSGRERWIRYTVTGPAELVRVVVDPDERLELDERWDNNARAVRPTTTAWRVWERLAYLLSVAAVVLSP